MTRNERILASRQVVWLLLVGLLATVACSGESEATAEAGSGAPPAERMQPNPLRNAYFGDTHVHTRHSFDAYIFNTRASPDDAYRFAKGESIAHPSGYQIQLGSGPLDFQAVSDHGLYLGAMSAMDDPDNPLYDVPLAKELRELETGGFARAIRALRSGEMAALDTRDAKLVAWKDIIEAAERHNDPGTFTTFIGYEYTASAPDRGNLHRNVIFRSSAVPEAPFATTDSPNPEDLWRWLDGLRAQGIEALAIPHNSNGSNGHMFQLETVGGEPFDAEYAELRMRNEPLVEITQVKGTSEVHPLFSPNDEWADFEIFPYRIATRLDSDPEGSYVREAYINGLLFEEKQGFNPFHFGVIGSTDTHNAGGTPEEDDYHSKVGTADGTPQLRGSVPLDEPGPDGQKYAAGSFHLFGASGLAGVWAEENTRESIYDAFRRKETFATTGPRVQVRFFAGYGYSEDLASDRDMIANAYDGGVPMGADLLVDGDSSPRFLVWATRDLRSAPLQRLQIVKGWVADGEAREQVFDVACSDGLEPDSETYRCADNGATVDLGDCSISKDVGAAELTALWTDPDFDASHRSVYYLRVLENPVCRWSTWDALRAGVDRRPDVPATIQERAFSSPIWLVPKR